MPWVYAGRARGGGARPGCQASPRAGRPRGLITDCVRAVDAVAQLPGPDSDRVVVSGGSQGGGLALAVAGLNGDRVAAVMPDVPFLCHRPPGADPPRPPAARRPRPPPHRFGPGADHHPTAAVGGGMEREVRGQVAEPTTRATTGP
ncbi:acetylxylan esterase [Streptomyces sp. NPDC059994]|uniref:acetylxylan esterase n=1 Tax=Streptomyces sp. NPDC059994 TaxID=3347029 RepID=UPI0036CC1BAC